MSVTGLEFPRPVADMCADLAGQGFDVLTEQHGAGVMVLELQGPVNVSGQWQESFVRISADLGHWSVSVRFEEMARWIWAQVWQAYLDGCELGEPNLDQQTTFVRTRLPEAGLALRARPGTERELVLLTDRYLRRRLGLTSS
jgi:hypothetical protein